MLTLKDTPLRTCSSNADEIVRIERCGISVSTSFLEHSLALYGLSRVILEFDSRQEIISST